MMKEALSRRVRELEEPEPDERIAVEPAPEAVLEGLREALLGGETHYTDRPGLKALRARIASRLGREPDSVIITAGEKEALYVIGLTGLSVPIVRLGEDLLAERARNLDATSIVVGTLDFLPGLRSFRLAYVSAPIELAPKLRSWKQALSICTAAPSQRAALVSLPS